MMSRRGEAEPALDLPPGYRLVSLREGGDAFAHALGIAAQAGAGALIQVGRYDLVEVAVILEPDEPLVSARRAIYAGMNAIGDAIAFHCPPEHEVSFAWPDTILFDQGLLGGARLGWPPECAEDDVPAWLVLGIMLRAADLAHIETGAVPGAVSLVAQGFELVETDAIVASFARQLMAGFDRWNELGFDPIAADYLARVPPRKAGERRHIERNGDLLMSAPLERGPSAQSSLVGALARAAWYDPALRGPRVE